MRDVRSVIQRDHANAQKVATGVVFNLKSTAHPWYLCTNNALFSAICDLGDDVIRVDLNGVHSNLILVETVKPGLTAAMLCDKLSQVSNMRLVYDVTPEVLKDEWRAHMFCLQVSELEEKEIGERVRVIVKSVSFFKNILRIAIHKSITDSDVDLLIRKLAFAVQELRTV